MTGKIEVRVQREDRLRAITELSVAIRCVAEALKQAPEVVITNNTLNNMDTGINLDLTENVIKTEIVKDSSYTHVADSAEVTVGSKRKYEIIFEAGFNMSEGDVIEVHLERKVNAGSYSELDCSKAYCGA